MPFNNITDEEQSELMMTTKSNNSSEKQIHEDLNSGNSSSGVSEDEEHDYDSEIVNKIKSVQNLKMSGAESDRLLSLPSKGHEKFLRTLFDNVLDKAIFDGTKRENKVLEWTDPEELQKKFNMDLKVSLEGKRLNEINHYGYYRTCYRFV